MSERTTTNPTTQRRREYQHIDLTGRRIGRLIVLSHEHVDGRIMWTCVCDCKVQVVVDHKFLKRHQVQSCGCLRRDRCRTMNTTHGMSTTPEWAAWRNANDRCYRRKHHAFPEYGGRGIIVCDRWRGEHGFENFLADVGPRPSPKHSLDRYPNNDGNYEPGNARWATDKSQMRNRRAARLLTFNGVTATVAEWSERTGFRYTAIWERLRRGWSIERALTEAIQVKD